MKLLVLILLLLTLSCSKKEVHTTPVYTAEEFTALSHSAEPSNGKGEEGIKFSDYSPGVNIQDSRALKFERLLFFALAYSSEDEAKNEAKRLNQYYARNWLFDRVEGEPILEDYVISTFKAVNPNRKIQRVPKTHPAEHASGHGEVHGQEHGAHEAHSNH